MTDTLDDDEFPLPLWEPFKTHLVIIPGLSWDEWSEKWNTLDQTQRSLPWWVGDALVYAQDSFGEQWSQAVDAQYAEQYARYLRVSRLVPLADRREGFSWSAHREVATLSSTERAEIFDLAEENGWRSREIRDEVQRRKAAERPARYPSNGAPRDPPPAEGRSTWNDEDNTFGDPIDIEGEPGASQGAVERGEAAEAPEAVPEPLLAPTPASGDEADYIRALIAAIRRLAPEISPDWRFGAIVDKQGQATVTLTKGDQIAIGMGESLPCAVIEASLSAVLSDKGAG